MSFYNELEQSSKEKLHESRIKLGVTCAVLGITLASVILLCIAVSVYVYRLQY